MNSFISSASKTKATLCIEHILLYGLFLFLPYYGAQSGGFQFVDIIIAAMLVLGVYNGSFFLFFQRDNLLKPRVWVFLLWAIYTFVNLLFHFFFSAGAPLALHVYPLYGLVVM